jgi:hypothetical protein
MRKGEAVDSHMSAEGIELSGSDWNSGRDMPYFFTEYLEDYLSGVVAGTDKDPDQALVSGGGDSGEEGLLDVHEFLSGGSLGVSALSDLLSGRDAEIEKASREEVMALADQTYDLFEDIFDVELSDEVRDEWQYRTVYDEGPGFKAWNTVRRTDFLSPVLQSAGGAMIGIVGNNYLAREEHDAIIDNGGGLVEANRAMEQATALNDEIALGALSIGLAYGLKQAYPSMKSDFTGKFHPSRPPVIRSLDLGGRDDVIAVTPDQKTPGGAFSILVSENLHMLQRYTDSPTTYDPLLTEGMDVFTEYVVSREIEDSGVAGIDHERRAYDIHDRALFRAYGIIKNNGGYMVDDDTFIDVGLDPEESKRMADSVESHMSRTDRTDEQLFGYSVGAGYLIMEYEKGNIDPAEVLEKGRDAMPWHFRQIYGMPMMDEI